MNPAHTQYKDRLPFSVLNRCKLDSHCVLVVRCCGFIMQPSHLTFPWDEVVSVTCLQFLRAVALITS